MRLEISQFTKYFKAAIYFCVDKAYNKTVNIRIVYGYDKNNGRRKNVMKKCISLLITLVMTLALLPAKGVSVQAATVYTNDSGVAASGTTPHYVKWTLYLDGTLYLYPDNASITRYLEAGDDGWAGEVWFPDTSSGVMVKVNGKEKVEHLVVAEGIGNIYERMFMEYPNLRTVTLYGVPLIQTEAFHGCRALESVTVYGSLDAIGDYAFSGCRNLTTFTATGTVDRIGVSAFSLYRAADGSNTALRSFYALRIGGISDYAFCGCESLVSVAPINGSVPRQAFKGTGLGSEDAAPVILVSHHSGTLHNDYPFPARTKLYYTGTKEEFQAMYTNNSGITPVYQMLSESVSWSLNGNELSINGAGRTIDLLEEIEQPWMNVPGAGTPDDQRDAITNVRVANDIECGAHVLDGLGNKLEPRYQATVNSGTSDGQFFHSGRYFADELVKIKANAPDPGKVFSAWSGAQGLTFTEGNANTAEAEFVMPARDVTLTATYETGYTLTVRNGSGSGLYRAGANVTVTANAAPEGKRFKEWSGISNSWIISGSKTSPTVTFTMPSYNDYIEATYEDICVNTVTVNGGTGGGSYEDGSSVTVTANVPAPGKRFKEWTGANGLVFTSGSATAATATFTMPKNAVTLTATYEDILYPVTVTGGAGGGDYTMGSAVTVTANAPAQGKRFKEWTGADGLVFTSGSADAATATFTMPAQAVSLTAVYEDILYSVSVISDGNGTATASPASGAAGTPVTLNAAPNEGFRFKEWQILAGDVTIENDSFSIGCADVAIKAVFEEIPTQPDDPTDPTTDPTEPVTDSTESTTEPTTEPADGDDLCKWCGEDHSGSFWQRIIGFFHSILYFFAHLFGRK